MKTAQELYRQSFEVCELPSRLTRHQRNVLRAEREQEIEREFRYAADMQKRRAVDASLTPKQKAAKHVAMAKAIIETSQFFGWRTIKRLLSFWRGVPVTRKARMPNGLLKFVPVLVNGVRQFEKPKTVDAIAYRQHLEAELGQYADKRVVELTQVSYEAIRALGEIISPLRCEQRYGSNHGIFTKSNKKRLIDAGFDAEAFFPKDLIPGKVKDLRLPALKLHHSTIKKWQRESADGVRATQLLKKRMAKRKAIAKKLRKERGVISGSTYAQQILSYSQYVAKPTKLARVRKAADYCQQVAVGDSPVSISAS